MKSGDLKHYINAMAQLHAERKLDEIDSFVLGSGNVNASDRKKRVDELVRQAHGDFESGKPSSSQEIKAFIGAAGIKVK